MQCAKDSFFLALQQRLAALNPTRTVTISGTTVPAIVVSENLPPLSLEPQPNTFYITWGQADVVSAHAGNSALMSLDVAISYHSFGSVPSMVDRGRTVAQLDSELIQICQPARTQKYDYTRSPSVDLGTGVFWDQPSLQRGSGPAKATADDSHHPDARVSREARLKIYFFEEVTLQ